VPKTKNFFYHIYFARYPIDICMRESYTQMGHLWNKINLVTSPKKKHILHSYWHLRFFAKSTELGNKIKFDNFLKCIHLNRHVVMGFFSFFLGYLMISIFWQKHSHKFSQFCTNTKSQTNCQKKKKSSINFLCKHFLSWRKESLHRVQFSCQLSPTHWFKPKSLLPNPKESLQLSHRLYLG
jgi:hypothetical protein